MRTPASSRSTKVARNGASGAKLGAAATLGLPRGARRNDATAALIRQTRRSMATEPTLATDAIAGADSLGQCVRRSLEQYFVNLDGAKPHALHDMVMNAVERPLIAFAMEKCGGNQCAAAQLLGINRNTLRKKLTDYGIDVHAAG